MLYFMITWLFLIGVCFSIGTAIVNWLKADHIDRRGDRFITAVWLGIIVLCISLLATSLILPLSSAVGLVLALGLVALSLLSQSTRSELAALRSILSPSLIVGFITLELIIAAFTSQKIVWFDTGLYHFGSIRWMSQFGAVNGLALINGKFGFTSSWFALAAPLTSPIFGSRVSAITNGFVFLIAILQSLITLNQIVSRKGRLSDWFLLIFSAIAILVYTGTAFTGSPILISFSPDVTVAFLIGVTAWSILVISHSAQSSLRDTDAKTPLLDAKTIPLILSAGAVTVKLSALPLLPIGFLFYLMGNQLKLKIKRLLTGSAITLLILSPIVLYSLTTSGCPLYPSTFMCLDLPWSVPIEEAIKETKPIKFWWVFSDSDESGLTAIALGVWRWLKGSIKSQIMALITIFVIVFSIPIFRQFKKHLKLGTAWIVLLGLLGITFILLQSPLLRFGLGYFLLIPALFGAICGQSMFEKIPSKLTQPL
ncbi:MAG: LIC_10190 family membrane protein, partial [Coleofasciculus sp.]